MGVASPHSILRIWKYLMLCILTRNKKISNGRTQVEGAEGRSPCRATIWHHMVTPHLPWMNERGGEPPNRGLTRPLEPNRPPVHIIQWAFSGPREQGGNPPNQGATCPLEPNQHSQVGDLRARGNPPNRGVTRSRAAKLASRVYENRGGTPPIGGPHAPWSLISILE